MNIVYLSIYSDIYFSPIRAVFSLEVLRLFYYILNDVILINYSKTGIGIILRCFRDKISKSVFILKRKTENKQAKKLGNIALYGNKVYEGNNAL